jgi:predicted secreted protein
MAIKRKGGRNLTKNSVVVRAMENGLIIRLDPLEFPVILFPGAFAVTKEEKMIKKKKGSRAFDSELFYAQNKGIAYKPTVAQLRKFIKDTNTNMQLAIALLRGDMGSNPNANSAAPVLRNIRENEESIKDALLTKNRRKGITQDQWDTVMVREYMKNMKKLAKYIPQLAKKIKKNPKYVSPLPKIPGWSSSAKLYKTTASAKKSKSKAKKQVTSGTKFKNAGLRIKKIAKQKGIKVLIGGMDLEKRQAWIKKHGGAKVSTRKGGKRTTARTAYQTKIIKKGNTYWRVLKSGKKSRTTKAAYQKSRSKK